MLMIERKSGMKDSLWMGSKVIRASYRAVLGEDVSEEKIAQAFAACGSEMEHAWGRRRLLTASLYRYGHFLFLYTEGVEERVIPEEMFPSMSLSLQNWPGVIENGAKGRVWVYMQSYYYHAVPKYVGEWMRGRKPKLRRGRIALLEPGMWEEYMEHHLALMKEGLIQGDRYHFISVHENVLFSYFEEPKVMTNLRRGWDMDGKGARRGDELQNGHKMCQEQEIQGGSGSQDDRELKSAALEDWLRTDPESHFMRFAPGQGQGPDQNFVFLQCCASI